MAFPINEIVFLRRKCCVWACGGGGHWLLPKGKERELQEMMCPTRNIERNRIFVSKPNDGLIVSSTQNWMFTNDNATAAAAAAAMIIMPLIFVARISMLDDAVSVTASTVHSPWPSVRCTLFVCHFRFAHFVLLLLLRVHGASCCRSDYKFVSFNCVKHYFIWRRVEAHKITKRINGLNSVCIRFTCFPPSNLVSSTWSPDAVAGESYRIWQFQRTTNDESTFSDGPNGRS